MNNDTICAIATPVGGALCVIRVSGGRVREIYAALVGGAPTAGRIRFARLKGKDGETLDEAMCAFFAAPKSYTGEDMLELYTHGGAYVVSAVSERLYGLGARQAEAGEWTPLYDRLTPYVLGMEPLPGLKGMKKRLTGEHKAAVKTRADEAANLFGQILELISCSEEEAEADRVAALPRLRACLLYTSPSPRD